MTIEMSEEKKVSKSNPRAPIQAGATPTANKKMSLKKLNADTTKLLSSLREKANKKDLGRKVRDSELIHLGLTKITADDLESIKESTYSEQDRLRLAHEAYQKAHGKLTLDQFIGKLLKGEINAGLQK